MSRPFFVPLNALIRGISLHLNFTVIAGLSALKGIVSIEILEKVVRSGVKWGPLELAGVGGGA